MQRWKEYKEFKEYKEYKEFKEFKEFKEASLGSHLNYKQKKGRDCLAPGERAATMAFLNSSYSLNSLNSLNSFLSFGILSPGCSV